MRYTTDTNQKLAILLAVVMATSVLAVGFVGSAAADTQNLDDIEITDGDELNVGEDGIEQTIELEKVQIDSDGGDIVVTADGVDSWDDAAFDFDGTESNYKVQTFELHDTGGDTGDLDQTEGVDENEDLSISVANGGEGGDNELTITFENNAESVTVNLELTVSLDLDNYDIQDSAPLAADEIEYTAAADSGPEATTTFDLLPPEPEFDSAEVFDDYPTWVVVDTTDEDIQVTDSDDAVDAFTFDEAGEYENVDEIVAVVEDVDDQDGLPDVATGDNEIALVLDGFVTSEEDATVEDAISYDSEQGGVAHADNSNVQPADASLNLDPDVAPTLISATVGDSAANVDSEDPNEVIQVEFSEDVELQDGSTLQNLAGEFENIDGTNVIDDNDDAIDITDNVVTITLDSAVEPGDDLRNALSAPDTGDFEHLESALGDTGAAEINDRDVENNVAPEVDSATFGPDGDNLPSELEVTFNDLDDSVDVADVDADEFTIDAESDVAIDEVTAVSGDTVTLSLEPVAEVGDDDVEVGHTGNDADLESTSTFSATTVAESSVDPADNDVKPVVTDVELDQDSLDEIDVTFTEDVEIVGEDSNVFVTDAFDLSDGDVHQGETNDDVLTLTLDEPLPSDTEATLDFTNGDGNPGDLVSAADSETEVQDFADKPVTSTALVEFAEVTYTPDAEGDGTYEIELKFNDNVDLVQDGTDSNIAQAFEIGTDTDQAAITEGDDELVDVTDNTITFSEVGAPDLNSAILLDASDEDGGLEYTASEGGEPLLDDDEAIDDFSTSVDNEIVPVIDDSPVTIEELEEPSPDEVVVPFSENIEKVGGATDADVADAFDIDGVTIADASVGEDDVTLELDEEADGDYAPGDLTYTAGPLESAEDVDITSEVLAEEGPLSVNVIDNVGVVAAIDEVVFDDVGENNDNDAGEMVIYFEEGVDTNNPGSITATLDDADGFTFVSDTTQVDIEFEEGGAEIDNDPEGTDLDNVSVVPFVSGSTSDGSTVNAGDTFGDDVELQVEDAESSIGIQVNGKAISEANVDDADDIHNQVAGDLDEVESTDIDVELVGTDQDEKSTAEITVTAPTDEDGVPVIDHDFELDIDGFDESSLGIDSLDKEDELRFDGEFTVDVNAVLGDDGEQDGAEEGETVDVDVADATVAHTDSVTFVHEAVTAASDGFALGSQPMPGELIAGDDINDVTYWDSNETDFETYDVEDQVSAVHYGLWIDAEEAGAEYGFAFDDDRDTRENIGSLDLGEGWHVVGSNFDITDNTDIDVQVDLSTSGDVDENDVAVQRADLPGTTLSGSANIGQYEGYYVFLHEEDERPIVLPEFDGKIEE